MRGHGAARGGELRISTKPPSARPVLTIRRSNASPSTCTNTTDVPPSSTKALSGTATDDRASPFCSSTRA
jgi:hypothetical protein